MIRVYTKERHREKINQFLTSINLEHEICTIKNDLPLKPFELGVSYAYPRKILDPILTTPKKGFVNYHPGPLPDYKGPNQYRNAIDNQEIDWGVTVHYMNEEYDEGPIIKVKKIKLHEPPTAIEELGAISHYFLFDLFKETILDIFNEKLESTPQ